MTRNVTRLQSFLCGLVFGACLAVLLWKYATYNSTFQTPIQPPYSCWKKNSGENQAVSTVFMDKDDNITADQLYHKVRVLCWIMTSPQSLQSRAKYVKDTWSKRCNIRLFMSSEENKKFPTVGLPVKEGRSQLYEKTKAAYKYIWKHYREKADWFLKADDDTFVVVENLRFLLKDHNPNTAIYFGKKFVIDGHKYMSGGAGYVLSKEATRRFVEGLGTKCSKKGKIEDLEIGKCLTLMGVEPGDSRDPELKERFHAISAAGALAGEFKAKSKYKSLNYYGNCWGNENCSSPFPITFHNAYGSEMNIYDYLIKAKVYGVSHYYRRYSKLPYES